jgi:hypothetical protein
MLCVVLNKNIFLPFNPLSTFQPSVSSTVRCPLYGPLSLTALCLLYCPLSFYGPLGLCLRLWYSVPSTALCTLNSPLPPQLPSISLWPSTALCPLYCPLSRLQHFSTLWLSVPLRLSVPPLQPSVSSMTLCPLWPSSPTTALWPLAKALCPLYGPVSSY